MKMLLPRLGLHLAAALSTETAAAAAQEESNERHRSFCNARLSAGAPILPQQRARTSFRR
jgi:hypothetical protein